MQIALEPLQTKRDNTPTDNQHIGSYHLGWTFFHCGIALVSIRNSNIESPNLKATVQFKGEGVEYRRTTEARASEVAAPTIRHRESFARAQWLSLHINFRRKANDVGCGTQTDFHGSEGTMGKARPQRQREAHDVR
jgi:hypothetical protein